MFRLFRRALLLSFIRDGTSMRLAVEPRSHPTKESRQSSLCSMLAEGVGFAQATAAVKGRFRHDHDRFFSHSFAFGVPWPGSYDPDYLGSYEYDYPYANYTASDYSDVILAVQRALAQLGYYDGSLDGVVGPQTKKAIRWFQSVDRLPVTGEIDPATLRALRIG